MKYIDCVLFDLFPRLLGRDRKAKKIVYLLLMSVSLWRAQNKTSYSRDNRITYGDCWVILFSQTHSFLYIYINNCFDSDMSTAMNFGTKTFQPRPPDKGSFPLDHFGKTLFGNESAEVGNVLSVLNCRFRTRDRTSRSNILFYRYRAVN